VVRNEEEGPQETKCTCVIRDSTLLVELWRGRWGWVPSFILYTCDVLAGQLDVREATMITWFLVLIFHRSELQFLYIYQS
jgi:hypothetical protein